MAVENRCDVCKGVLHPCVDCVTFQKGIDKSQKEAAKAAMSLARNGQDRAK
jgi:hypothetical protein